MSTSPPIACTPGPGATGPDVDAEYLEVMALRRRAVRDAFSSAVHLGVAYCDGILD